MSFEWKLPKIKLPHFKASGSWSLVPPKFPKFSVDWYANGCILNSPTIFGMNGDRMMGGGEAGAEAVLPIDLLKTYIRDEMQSNNTVLAQLIAEALSELTFVIENNISLGDKKLADVLVDARVIELKWDAVRNKLISVTLGKFQYNFLNNVSSIMNRVEQAIRSDGSLIGQQVQGTINGVKAQLRAQSSIAKKQTVRAVLFEDLDPDSPTFGAMCLGTLGFEIASERTADGRDWKWSTFGTGQGFFADFIVAGTMLADRIKGGTLELGGAGNGNGVAKVLNADGNEIVRLDKDGVYAKGKYVCANTDGSQTATLSNGKLTFKTESYEVVIRAGAIGGLTGLMIYPEQGAVRTKFLSIGDKLSARFDNISLLASGKTTIGGASLEVQRDGKGYSGKTGKAVFSDGTYLEYVNGFLVGGNTKEGGF